MTILSSLPCHAVIFVSQRRGDDNGYGAMAQHMATLASQQPGFVGVHSARDAAGKGITVVFFDTEQAATNWGRHPEHRVAQQSGRGEWYESFEIYHSRVERGYTWKRDE